MTRSLFRFLAIQIFENSIAFVYALLVVDAGFSALALGSLLAIPAFSGFLFNTRIGRYFGQWHWVRILQLSLAIAAVFVLLLVAAEVTSLYGVFLIAAICWYIYYELFCFAQQKFVIEEYKKKEFSSIWGKLYAVMQTGWVVGPVIGAVLLSIGASSYYFLYGGIVAFVALTLKRRASKNTSEEYVIESDSIPEEPIFKWTAILKRVSPVVVAYVLLLLVTEAFQNIGGLFGDSLNLGREYSWIIVSTFSFSMIAGPVFLSKYSIARGKKYLSLLFMIVGGAVLGLLAFVTTLPLILLTIVISGLCFSVALPLEEAVFSDFSNRSPGERTILLAIVRIAASTAYILSPLVSGTLVDYVGYQYTFALIGVTVAISALLLRATTPQKIGIPHMFTET